MGADVSLVSGFRCLSPCWAVFNFPSASASLAFSSSEVGDSVLDLAEVAEISLDCGDRASRLGFSLKSGGVIGDVSSAAFLDNPTAGVS